MARTCSKCNYSNLDTSHYCVKCGAPLEKTWLFPKRYKVIAETELDSLTNERNRLRKQINDSWGIKIEKWIKDNKNTIVWTIASIFALFFLGWMFTKCDFSTKVLDVIEIRKDEASGKYGIYNNESNILVTQYEYDSIQHRNWVDAESYKRNYYCLFRNNLIGIADSSGAVTVSCNLSSIEGAYSGLIIMRCESGNEGLLDTYGTPLFDTNYYRVLWEKTPVFDFYTSGTYVGNIIPVKRSSNSGWELFDRTGKRISSKSYPEVIQTGVPNLIKVKLNGYYGLVNTKGQEVLRCNARWISRYQEDIAFVDYPNSKYLYAINLLGNKIFSISKEYKTQWLVKEGLFARMDSHGKIGYYDKTGKLVIPHKYEQTKDGNTLIQPNFHNDSAFVSYQGEKGVLLKEGTFNVFHWCPLKNGRVKN